MKKLKMLVFTLVSFLLMGYSVNAENVTTSEELIECLSKSGTCTLSNNLEVSDRMVIDAGKTVELDLNGKILDLTHLTDNYAVLVKGSLTIKGNGTFNIANTYGIGVTGTLLIENGTFNHPETGTYLIGNWGNTTINDGIFNAGYCAVNGFSGTAVIKDGEFKSNPDFDYDSDDENLYYWGVLGNVEVQKGTFNQILGWPNLLTENSEVTYKLDDVNNLYDVVDLKGKVTIDLNGHNIVQKSEGKNVFNIQDGNINITGSGKIISHSSATSAIRILGSTNSSDKEYTTVTIGKDVTVESNGYAAFITAVEQRAYGVEVNIYGTLKGGYNGFYVNGQIQDVDKNNFENFPVVNIKDGANVEGIYAGGYATWNIGAAKIEDKEFGLGIKAGNFVVDGATITATGEKVEPTGNGDGINGTGSAIQFETNAKYADNIDVTLKNVTVSSTNGYAILEYLGQTKILNLEILSGTFKSAKDLEIIKVSENFDKTGFIKGGTYSADVKEYIATGLVSKKIGDMYTVGEEYSVELNTVANGTVKISSAKAFVGEKITLTLKPNDGYELSSIKVVDTYNKEVSVTGNEFVMPNSNVKVVVEFKKITITSEIPVIDPDKKVEETVVGVKDEASVEAVILDTIAKDTELSKKIEGTSVKVEVVIDEVEAANVPKFVADSMKKAAGNATITNFFDITIALKNATGTINETISELTKEIELMVVLPEELRTAKDGMTRKYYIVREHEVDGKSQVDLLDAKVSEDGKYLTFKTDKFSTYAIAIDDQVLEQTPDNGENSNTPSTPQTGDNVMLYISLGFISVATIGISLMNLKRRSSKN